MIDNILNLVKNEVTGLLSGDSNIPGDKKDKAIEATTSGFLDGLKEQALGGVLSSALGSKGEGASNLVSQTILAPIMSSVESKLVGAVGLSQSSAKGIASMVVPAVMKLLSLKSSDGNDSFDFSSLISGLISGDSKGGVLGSLGSLFGKS